MKRKPYMPRSDEKRRDWLNIFVGVLKDSANGLAAKYSVDATNLTRLDEGRQLVVWIMDGLPEARLSVQNTTVFKDNLFNGSGAISLPVDFVLPKPPSVTLYAGVFVLAAQMAALIKNAPNYDPADGEMLGIEGAEQVMPDPATTAPKLEIRRATGGLIEIVWPKSVFEGITLQVDRGDGSWKFLAVDTEPNYIDTVKPAAGQSAIYKYRGIYLLHDADYGQWSAVVEATVGG